MTTAYFDCFSGISGDMTLGAFVDLGVPVEELKNALSALPVDGYTLSAEAVQRCGIGGTYVKVHLHANGGGHSHEPHDHHHHDHKHGHGAHEHAHHHEEPHSHQEHGHEHSHEHTHSHGHEHTHSHEHHHEHKHDDAHHHDHGHEHSHKPEHHAHRGFTEIRGIIEKSGFSSRVKDRAVEAFHRIAVEEAAVHGSTIEQVHFHEVGAVDAIVDIVGAMWCLDFLGIEDVIASPVAVGSGTVRAAHGDMPVPAPATARLLAGVPISTGPVSGELTTPTGAAILTTIATRFAPLENFRISKIGYGAGTRTYKTHPNYLRVLLGTAETTSSGTTLALPGQVERLSIITTEIDDMSGENFGYVFERLFAIGCLDVHAVPIQMKKNRPGVTLQVLAREETVRQALELIFRETSTFGVKVVPCDRYSLNRRMETIETPVGTVRFKLGLWNQEILKASPEYEDCRRIAEEKKLPLAKVYEIAAAAAAQLKG